MPSFVERGRNHVKNSSSCSWARTSSPISREIARISTLPAGYGPRERAADPPRPARASARVGVGNRLGQAPAPAGEPLLNGAGGSHVLEPHLQDREGEALRRRTRTHQLPEL